MGAHVQNSVYLEPTKNYVSIWRIAFVAPSAMNLFYFSKPAKEKKKVTYFNFLIGEMLLSRTVLTKCRPPIAIPC